MARTSCVIAISNRQRSLRPDRDLIRRTLSAILRERERTGTLSVALVGDEEIRIVHRDHLGIDAPTDVLSFLYDDGDAAAGSAGPFAEVVVSAETALREARARGIAPGEELLRYAIHGLLHVLGEDDTTPAARRRMKALEARYLRRHAPRALRRAPRRR